MSLTCPNCGKTESADYVHFPGRREYQGTDSSAWSGK